MRYINLRYLLTYLLCSLTQHSGCNEGMCDNDNMIFFDRRKFSVRQYIPSEMDMMMKPPMVAQNLAPPMCM